MKTKTLFVLFLLLGVATIQLSAQTGAVKGIETKPEIKNFEIWCDGAVVDKLNSEKYDLREIVFYKNGNLEWWKSHVNNVIFTSSITGEVFKGQVNDAWKEDINLYHQQFFLIGNKGSHYLFRAEYDGTTWTFIGYSSNCH
jgi:hypothetical protein